MGLFMNEEKHPEVYKNDEKLVEPNQHIYRRDEMIDLLKSQRKSQNTMHQAIQELEKVYTKQSKIQTRRLANVRFHIDELYEGQRKKQENDSLNSKSMDQFQEKIGELTEKMEQQMAIQKEALKKLGEQEAFQEEVLQRLENQEALMEKILRKVDHFRSILYERTNFISEKIGKGYEATSAYIANLIKNNKSAEEKAEEPEKIK